MNFFKDPTTEIDQDIQQIYYPGLQSEADGIDLRIEMDRILNGYGLKKPLGHWVVLRVFNPNAHSSYFNKYTKEGVMGPSREYVDVLLRSRRVPHRFTGNSLDNEKVGEISDLGYKYYFEWFVEVKPGDQIYEIDAKDHKLKPTTYKFTEKYDIKQVHPYRLENGNVQYIAAISEFNNISY